MDRNATKLKEKQGILSYRVVGKQLWKLQKVKESKQGKITNIFIKRHLRKDEKLISKKSEPI